MSSSTATSQHRARTERLLRAPIAPTLLRLATPGIALVAFQSAVSMADAYFVGRLGTEPLAGIALVFPLVMLLQMMSAGAMGGGVSSAIARALGAGQVARARNLVVHALLIGIGMGVLFTALMLLSGPFIYRLLGGSSGTLEQAISYSNMLFAGSVLVWLANTLASILRGSGNMLVPAIALALASLLHVPLSGWLVLGFGEWRGLGIAGAGVAYVAAAGFSSMAMLFYLLRPSGALRPGKQDMSLDPALFVDILRVGAVSSLSAVQTVLTAIVLTGVVGAFGTAALAGYGVGIRLELLQVPLVFAVGQALVAMIGTNIGAGQAERAKQIAWTGAFLSAGASLAIGAFVAVFPAAWIGLFSSDPGVLDVGSTYLRIVGPFYPFLALGVSLYFASQGAGKVVMPVVAGTLRLAVAALGSICALRLGAPLWMVFCVISAALAVYGGFTAWAILRSSWSTK